MKRSSKLAQFNFTWLFAIFAGGAILVLAIYGATQSGQTSQYRTNTETAKSIEVLTNPLEAGYAEGKYSTISFRSQTRIINSCLNGSFGENKLIVSTRTDSNTNWENIGGSVTINNKYIFSENNLASTDYTVFSKPFYFPYKVTDMIFLISKNYCFENVPNEILEDIKNLGIPNIELKDCSNESEVVCFGKLSSNCDIIVYPECNENICENKQYDRGTVVKDSNQMPYIGNLMYAAIFSSEENYLCNIDRLLYRAKLTGQVYSNKIDLMRARGCSNGAKPQLTGWIDRINSTSPEDIGLPSIYSTQKTLDELNSGDRCSIPW